MRVAFEITLEIKLVENIPKILNATEGIELIFESDKALNRAILAILHFPPVETE